MVGLLILLVIILFWKFDLRLRIEKIVGHYHTGSEDPAVAGSSIAMGTPAWVDPQVLANKRETKGETAYSLTRK